MTPETTVMMVDNKDPPIIIREIIQPIIGITEALADIFPERTLSIVCFMFLKVEITELPIDLIVLAYPNQALPADPINVPCFSKLKLISFCNLICES